MGDRLGLVGFDNSIKYDWYFPPSSKRVIDDHLIDPPEQYWRIGPYLLESIESEEVDRGVFLPFVHRPVSRYVNAMADYGLVLRRMYEPRPPQGFLARAASYRDAATIPRLLVLVAERVRR